MNRPRALANYILDRLGESSTWQGIGFVFALFGSKHFASLDWGGATAFGGFVSAAIKATFPDKLKGD